MFAIAFDLVVAETQRRHPIGVSQAYADTRTVLDRHGFEWKQGSLYTSETEDLAALFSAVSALKSLTLVCRECPRHPRFQGRAVVRLYEIGEVLVATGAALTR